MTLHAPSPPLDHRKGWLVAAVGDFIPDIQRRAVALDGGREDGAFPADDLDLLRGLGALAAPLPVALGGLGMGTEPEGAPDLMELLRLLGRGSLSLGRLYEAHVNALRLIVRYGTDAQARRAGADARSGHLFGLWVTDLPEGPLRLAPDLGLSGGKAPCSAAGYATRALVTVQLPGGGAQMLVINASNGARVDHSNWRAAGMRATASGSIELDGISIAPDALIGLAGDYLRQPDFSAGAWRTSAVTLGGIEALIAEMRGQLVARGRDGDPYQRLRVGRALIAQETARLWVQRAAHAGEANRGDGQDIVGLVNLARIAVEAAGLEVIQLAQRALGLSGFQRGGLAELLFRDLGVYLRQPAPDEVLDEAAARFMQRELPALPRCA